MKTTIEITKLIIEGINDLLNNDKFLGLIVVIILSGYVAGLKEPSSGVMEWFKMALTGVLGTVMGYNYAMTKKG